MVGRHCAFKGSNGEPCPCYAVKDSDFCVMHAPERLAEMQDARRLGGLRRKRERTVTGAYELGALDTVAGIRRVLEIAVMDTLGMENSMSRSRTLAYLAQVLLRTLEVGELEQRVANLEIAVHGRRLLAEPPAFDAETTATSVGEESHEAGQPSEQD